ncbi:MAG: hemolysin family protein, partial [Anaerolineae bacterium]|nr:hemolysin family protein [Anaerolineae bacterium]
MDWLIVFSVIVFLIFINALYVAAEFSTVSTRPSRLAQKAKLGDQLAEDLLAIVENPRHLDTYIATCQVGITISSLALGFMGQSRIAEALSPLLVQYGDITDLLANSLSVTFILVIFSVLQILFGELIPKNIGIQFPERMALLTAIPMRMSIIVFKPLIWVFNGSGQILMKLFNLDISSEHTHIHAPQEIAMLVEESGAGGAINPEEQRLIKNTLKLRQAHARQVMIPRTKMLTAPDDMPPRDMLELLADSPYSRLPLYTGTVDNIVGVVHLKELLCFEKFNDSPDIHSIMHTVPFIPETMPVKNVFDMLQNRRFQVAIVMDEFGGTQGMVTLEDLIEE